MRSIRCDSAMTNVSGGGVVDDARPSQGQTSAITHGSAGRKPFFFLVLLAFRDQSAIKIHRNDSIHLPQKPINLSPRPSHCPEGCPTSPASHKSTRLRKRLFTNHFPFSQLTFGLSSNRFPIDLPLFLLALFPMICCNFYRKYLCEKITIKL